MLRQAKLSVARAFSGEYKKSSKKEKTLLLNKLSKITGYSRKHLMAILPYPLVKRRWQRKRISPYLSVLKLLKKLWVVSNYACGKRLAPMIPVYLSSLGRFHELPRTTKEERKLLRRISPATCDRLLAHDRRRINLGSRSKTKPGSLLKNQIPIRTFSDWKDEENDPVFWKLIPSIIVTRKTKEIICTPSILLTSLLVGMNAGPLWERVKGTQLKLWK